MPRFTKLNWLIGVVIGIVKSVDIRDAQPKGWVNHMQIFGRIYRDIRQI